MDGWRENQELWLWHLRTNVFTILVTREDHVILPKPNLGRKSMCVLHKYVNKLRNVWFRFYPPRNWGIYRIRWLRRWRGLHYTATWAKRFCTAKFSNNNNNNNKWNFGGWTKKWGLTIFNTRFLWKRYTCWMFCFAETEDLPVINTCDIVLKLP